MFEARPLILEHGAHVYNSQCYHWYCVCTDSTKMWKI